MLTHDFKSQFESLANLVKLYIYDNSTTDNIGDFSELANLVKVYLYNNPLEDATDAISTAISTLIVNGVNIC
jgi:Leucine-rich repeat (LRR) protein